jgi:RTX calcium-binding nonapeptide repeat (4 copies)/von Willebrand factor type A domain/Calx-beta domain
MSKNLQTTAGDGELQVTVDEFGQFGSSNVGGKSAFYDPIGSKTSSSTTYKSYLALGIIGTGASTVRTQLSSSASNNELFGTTSTTNANSTFTVGGLQFKLNQNVQNTFNSASAKTGSRLDQTYTITNTTNQAINFDLVRYVDGDLDFDGSLIDGGGRLVTGGQDVLFETDRGGSGATDTTFFGITANGGTIPTTNRWELDYWSTLSSHILAGNSLQNKIVRGDSDNNQFIDTGAEYDVGLSLRNVFSLAAGQSTTYTTTTRFGSGEPRVLDITPPTGGVGTLAATTLGNKINLTWGATDPSGIKNYDVFVSVNGSTFTSWLTNVTTTRATYTGEIGKTYKFYSLATDNAGNEQLASTARQTSTQLINPITLAVSPATVKEDGTNNLIYTFTRTGSTTNALTVKYDVGGTATLTTDYTQTGAASFAATTGTVTFAVGATTAKVIIDPKTDTTRETNETVTLKLASGNGYTVGTTAAVAGTIVDDDTLGKIKGIKWNDINGNGVREELIQGNPPDIVFVIDVSGSTSAAFQGLSVGDVNGDGAANTRLDAEVAGFIALNNRLVQKGLGNKAKVSIVSFDSSANQFDMNLVASGLQLSTNAATDSNNNGIKDVEEILRSLRAGGGTNFESGLQKAATTFTSLGTLPGNGNLIFISDGENNTGGSYTDEVLSLKNSGVLLSAFGVGTNASLPNLKVINPNASIFNSTDQLLAVFDGLGSGSQSFKEPGLGGVKIYLDLNNNGVLDTAEPTQITAIDNINTTNIDETGQYSFNVAPGTYTVREVVPAGYTQSFPNSPAFHTVTVAAGQTVDNINFGNTTPSTVSLAVSPATVNEDGSTNLVYTFTRTGNLANALTTNYTVGGTATFNTDYTQTGATSFNATTGAITFAAGFSTAKVTINPKTDTIIEANETVTLKLASGTGYTVGTTVAVTGTIVNDDIDTIDKSTSTSGVYINLTPNSTSYIDGASVTLSPKIENVIGTKFDDSIIGNQLANKLVGGDGKDEIHGNAGDDTINGGIGNDTLFGDSGNDAINGGVGADLMLGGVGNDRYIVDNIGDKVVEATNSGTDTVESFISYGLVLNVENLTLTGTGITNGTGNALDNIIIGNNSNNILSGLAGNDKLSGGGGQDRFVYQTGSIFNTSAIGIDTITDFTINQDKLDLSKTTFSKLSGGLTFANVANDSLVNASSAFVVYSKGSGKLFYNENGNGLNLGTGNQFAQLTVGLNLSNSDFNLVA